MSKNFKNCKTDFGGTKKKLTRELSYTSPKFLIKSTTIVLFLSYKYSVLHTKSLSVVRIAIIAIQVQLYATPIIQIRFAILYNLMCSIYCPSLSLNTRCKYRILSWNARRNNFTASSSLSFVQLIAVVHRVRFVAFILSRWRRSTYNKQLIILAITNTIDSRAIDIWLAFNSRDHLVNV